MWLNLTVGYNSQAIECVLYLRLFFGTAGAVVLYDYPQVRNQASQLFDRTLKCTGGPEIAGLCLSAIVDQLELP